MEWTGSSLLLEKSTVSFALLPRMTRFGASSVTVSPIMDGSESRRMTSGSRTAVANT